MLVKDRCRQDIKRVLANSDQRIQNYEKLISMLHPANTLKRGFSITRRKSGGVLKSKKDVSVGEVLLTEIVDGEIESTVK